MFEKNTFCFVPLQVMHGRLDRFWVVELITVSIEGAELGGPRKSQRTSIY